MKPVILPIMTAFAVVIAPADAAPRKRPATPTRSDAARQVAAANFGATIEPSAAAFINATQFYPSTMGRSTAFTQRLGE